MVGKILKDTVVGFVSKDQDLRYLFKWFHGGAGYQSDSLHLHGCVSDTRTERETKEIRITIEEVREK